MPPKQKRTVQRGRANSQTKAQQLYQELDLDYKYKIKGGNGFDMVEFELKPGQTIVSESGSMNYFREGVDKGVLSNSGDGGFWSGIGRVFAGQNAFLVSYTGLMDVSNRFVAFSSSVPGSIMHITLRPGQELLINRGSFIACSPNVQITGKLNWRGFLGIGQGEGGVLPKLTCKGDRDGHVWLGAFGHFEKHELKTGQSIIVDNGFFLASIASENKDEPIYTLDKLGKSIFSSALGGEGIGMKFVGPRIVYTHSHDVSHFAFEIAQLMPKRKE